MDSFEDLTKHAANENIPDPESRSSIGELRKRPDQILGNLITETKNLTRLQKALTEHIDEVQNKGPSKELHGYRLTVKDVNAVLVQARTILEKHKDALVDSDTVLDVLADVRDWEEAVIKIVGPRYAQKPNRTAEKIDFPYRKQEDSH